MDMCRCTQLEARNTQHICNAFCKAVTVLCHSNDVKAHMYRSTQLAHLSDIIYNPHHTYTATSHINCKGTIIGEYSF